ncbi:hypothetical protein WN51_09956 [Melipona quadrifasciata]|uniref:Uncharacterized protein n=1 Tax=Melipona quadrifasciata TaxID=166423 RepID=A0A0N0BKS9_9HYME|nr:hypothetical protein WN51_09956 [Melipona quadrifasciata]
MKKEIHLKKSVRSELLWKCSTAAEVEKDQEDEEVEARGGEVGEPKKFMSYSSASSVVQKITGNNPVSPVEDFDDRNGGLVNSEALTRRDAPLRDEAFQLITRWASMPEKYLLHLAPVTTGETDVSPLSGLRLEQKL